MCERRWANRTVGDYAWQLADMRQVTPGAGPSVVFGRCEVPAGSRHAQIGGQRRGDHGEPACDCAPSRRGVQQVSFGDVGS